MSELGVAGCVPGPEAWVHVPRAELDRNREPTTLIGQACLVALASLLEERVYKVEHELLRDDDYTTAFSHCVQLQKEEADLTLKQVLEWGRLRANIEPSSDTQEKIFTDFLFDRRYELFRDTMECVYFPMADQPDFSIDLLIDRDPPLDLSPTSRERVERVVSAVSGFVRRQLW